MLIIGISFEAATTYYSESIIGKDNFKEKLCTLVNMTFPYENCPNDLKSLVKVLIPPNNNPSVRASQYTNASHNLNYTDKDIHKSSSCLTFITKVVASLPLGASNSNKALQYFHMLSPELSLLRDVSKYSVCDGLAFTIFEQLDDIVHANSGDFKHSSNKNWLGCTFVYNDNVEVTSKSIGAIRETDTLSKNEVQVWLDEDLVSAGGIGGIISIRGDIVHLQLYALASHNENPRDISLEITQNESPHYIYVDYTLHLSVYESHMVCDDDDDDVNNEKDNLMSWGKLTGKSIKAIRPFELALYYKKLVIHLLAMRDHIDQIRPQICVSPSESIMSNDIGLIYDNCDTHSNRYQYRDQSSIKSIYLENYNPDIPRQFQFRKQNEFSKNGTDISLIGEGNRLCGVVITTSQNDAEGVCFTLMGDGRTRGIFRKDYIIMDYIPDLQVILHAR
jgi:hypothetical protein